MWRSDGDDAADRHDLAVAAAVELADRRVRLAPQLVADPRQRMLGDVQPEHLLLEAQQLALVELVRRARRMVLGLHLLDRREVEDRALAGEPIGLVLLAQPHRLLEHLELPLREPGSAPHFTSASSTRLFDTDGSTRSAKSQIDSNGPSASRAAMIERHAPSPTPFTALRPKRIFPPTTAKSVIDSFTSGGSTSMPSSLHALT